MIDHNEQWYLSQIRARDQELIAVRALLLATITERDRLRRALLQEVTTAEGALNG